VFGACSDVPSFGALLRSSTASLVQVSKLL
jgi:hypothetical protein